MVPPSTLMDNNNSKKTIPHGTTDINLPGIDSATGEPTFEDLNGDSRMVTVIRLTWVLVYQISIMV